MSKSMLIGLLALACPIAASAERLIPKGECALIVASRKTVSEVGTYIRSIGDKRFLKVFRSSNGWYAISIGTLKPHEVTPVMDRWKKSGKIPQDSICSYGESYTSRLELDINPPRSQAPSIASTRNQNSIIPSSKCAIVVATKPTLDETISFARQWIRNDPTYQNQRRPQLSNSQVLKTRKGTYAISLGAIPVEKGSNEVSSLKKRGILPEGSNCVSGRDFVEVADINLREAAFPTRTVKPRKKNDDSLGDFLLLGLAWGAAKVYSDANTENYTCKYYCGSNKGDVYIEETIGAYGSFSKAEKAASKKLRGICEGRDLWISQSIKHNPTCISD